jgi:hypothetical protein
METGKGHAQVRRDKSEKKDMKEVISDDYCRMAASRSRWRGGKEAVSPPSDGLLASLTTIYKVECSTTGATPRAPI